MKKCCIASAFVILICPRLPAGQITEGLMVYYDFEEITEEGVVPDRSGNGYDGTIGGGGTLTLAEGVFGNAGHFEGPDPVYIELPTPIPHDEIPTDAITVTAWVNHDIMNEHMEIFMAMSSGQYTKQLCHFELRRGDMARFLIRTPVPPPEDIISINNVGYVPAEQWVHYAATYDSGSGVARLYINGEVVAEASATRKMYNNWDMGARVGYCVDNARPFFGYMDDFALWRRALSEEEILQVMEDGVQPQQPEAVFKRCDANADGEVNIADVMPILMFLFGGVQEPLCLDAADANDDGALNIADAIATLNYLFGGGEVPLPGPKVCGPDPTDDALTTCNYPNELCR